MGGMKADIVKTINNRKRMLVIEITSYLIDHVLLLAPSAFDN